MAGCLAGAQATWAEPSAPWMPSVIARHDIELLVDEAGLDLTMTQWPLPRAAVLHAIDALPAALPMALDAARVRVLRELEAVGRSSASLRIGSKQAFLAGFGDDATPGSSLMARTPELDAGPVALQLGARLDPRGSVDGRSQFRLDDSAVAIEAAGIQLQAWSHRSWWSPGWESSLVLGNNAPPFNGIGLQRASASRSESPWLAWLGPWNFEFFVAQTEDSSDPPHPYIVGQRLTLRPWRQLEIGLTRTAQWGGRGRTQTASSFLHMLTGVGLNPSTPAADGNDPANEMAGYDVRLGCYGGLRCAAYAQLIGEDQAGLFPSHFLGLYGIEGWSDDGRYRYFAEYSETGCRSPIGRPFMKPCAYRNHAYPEGYTDGGRWMGASAGPDSRIVTLGWLDAASETSLRLHAGRIGSRIGSYTPVTGDPDTSGRLLGASLRTTLHWGSVTIAPEIDESYIRTAHGGLDDARVALSLQTSLDGPFTVASAGLGKGLSVTDNPVWRPLLIGAGLTAASALLDRPLDDYARDHAGYPAARGLKAMGQILPVAGLGLAGVSWLAQRGTDGGELAYASVLSGVAGLAAAEIAKIAIDRAAPTQGLGTASFGQGPRRSASFPSAHGTVAWALVTPYAEQYDAPWLYGLAALTSAGRVMSRDHWLSDTVAGAALGYSLGDWAYKRSGLDPRTSNVHISISPRAVSMAMTF
ncbi:MAG: phosphatase PAP2 family protein [Proteobacteria bacterium]|nr:phosphatase PAP2 family protein [Pseudomonadota bacterium]